MLSYYFVLYNQTKYVQQKFLNHGFKTEKKNDTIINIYLTRISKESVKDKKKITFEKIKLQNYAKQTMPSIQKRKCCIMKVFSGIKMFAKNIEDEVMFLKTIDLL